MKTLKKLIVPSLIRIDLDIMQLSNELRFLNAQIGHDYEKTFQLENYVRYSDNSFEIQSDKDVKKGQLELFGIEINIIGSEVYLDYKITKSSLKGKKLSEVLKLKKGYLVSGDLMIENFREIQNKLLGVLGTFTDEYTRIGTKVFTNKLMR